MENRRVSMNRHTNLLQLEEHMYPLVDVTTPNVFRNLFPYSEVPKIAFNDRVVPHHMPDDIWITDTTFRDGQQSRAPYSTEQIVRIYDYLHKLGGPEGRIRASEFFLYSKKDRDAVEKCMERATSSRRLPAASVPTRKTSSLSAIWYERNRYPGKLL